MLDLLCSFLELIGGDTRLSLTEGFQHFFLVFILPPSFLKVYESFFSLLKADSSNEALSSDSSHLKDYNLSSTMEETLN